MRPLEMLNFSHAPISRNGRSQAEEPRLLSLIITVGGGTARYEEVASEIFLPESRICVGSPAVTWYDFL